MVLVRVALDHPEELVGGVARRQAAVLHVAPHLDAGLRELLDEVRRLAHLAAEGLLLRDDQYRELATLCCCQHRLESWSLRELSARNGSVGEFVLDRPSLPRRECAGVF